MTKTVRYYAEFTDPKQERRARRNRNWWRTGQSAINGYSSKVMAQREAKRLRTEWVGGRVLAARTRIIRETMTREVVQ